MGFGSRVDLWDQGLGRRRFGVSKDGRGGLGCSFKAWGFRVLLLGHWLLPQLMFRVQRQGLEFRL